MPISLANKTVLIVGGSGGIGRATAELFAEAGARCLVTARFGRGNAGAVASLPGEGHLVLEVDVADTASILRLRDAVAAQAGRLDVLVNTAGFTEPVAHGDLESLTDDLIDRMFQVNWRGVFATIRAFAPLLRASGDGLVLSVSSIAGSTGAGSNIAYCAVKAATDVMTKSLARALAPEIRVLAVAPGVVATDFVAGRGAEANARLAASIPLRRIAEAQDVASAILACATHLTYATGSIIEVDGGRRLG